VIHDYLNGLINTSKVELGSKSEMGVEQTLILIKPDAFKRKLVGKIIQRFEEKGFNIKQLKTYDFTDEKAQDFYSIHRSKPFFKELVSFVCSGTVVACILEGNNAVSTVRIMIGLTKSFDAAPGTIRGDFGLGISDNIIHASDSHESFIKESSVVFL
jgi:nucleoside-diphosphate kinase